MTVRDLILKLKNYPQDLIVLVDGYEGGYVELKSIFTNGFTYDEEAPAYYGPYELDIDSKTKAVVLARYGQNEDL